MNGLGKDSVTWLEVGEEADGQRLDNFLLRLAKGVPKSHVYRIVRGGEVRVNKARARPEQRLRAGDVLRLPPLRIAGRCGNTPARDFPVVHEDAALLVLDKPAGVAVHGGSGVTFGLIEQLRRARPQDRLLELAHRLDRETSGLLVVARTRPALARLHELFRDGQVGKRYYALVKGRWRDALRHVRLPLRHYRTAEGEKRVAVSDAGQAAHSVVRRLDRWLTDEGWFSLVEVELKTGRTHQIRVHLAHLGHPLCGDDKYGDFALNRRLTAWGLKRMFLHAAHLSLPHPSTGAMMHWRSALPAELIAFRQQLDDLAARKEATDGVPL